MAPSRKLNLSRPRHFVFAIMTAVILAVSAVTAAALLQSRSRVLHEGEQVTRDMAKLMQNQMIHILDVANTILAIESIDIERHRNGGTATHQPRMVELIRDKPYLFRIFIADAKGDVIATSMVNPPALNIAIRSYYKRHIAGEKGPLITSGVQSQASGEPIMVMSRSILGPDGRTQGVAMVSFNLEGLAHYFRTLAPVEFGSIFQLIADDGRILVDVSPPPDFSQKIIEPDIWDLIKKSRIDSAVYQSIDGTPRLWAHRAIPGTDLFIRVGTDRSQIMRKWNQDLADYAMVGLVAFVALMGLTGVAVRYADREESALQKLRELNTELEQRVSERTQKLEALTQELQKSLEEKNILLREVHHRVKNNLQVVASMVRFSSHHVDDPQAQTVFAEIARRIRAIGLVHQTIYEQEAVSSVSVQSYLERLSRLEGDVYGIAERGIVITTEGYGELDINTAISMGLVVSEALVNAIKHAFPDAGSGEIMISASVNDQEWHVVIADNGVGFDEQHDAGTGIALMRALVGQMRGSIRFTNDHGTRVEMIFPIFRTPEASAGEAYGSDDTSFSTHEHRGAKRGFPNHG